MIDLNIVKEIVNQETISQKFHRNYPVATLEVFKALFEEIESLKCCGNCKWRLQDTSDCCLSVSPYYTYMWVDADSKCDHWQKL